MAKADNRSRRDLLLGGAALAGVAWGWQIWVHRPRPLAFEDIPGLPGWRRVTTGEVTGGGGNATSAVFAGLSGEEAVPPWPANRLCPAVFRDRGDEVIPFAMFTDPFCPYCRVLMPRLIARGMRVTWHEWPLLGPASELASRAGVAAGLQGGYEAYQTRLMSRPFRPSPVHIAGLAEEAGLDSAALLQAMDGAEVAERLLETRRIASTLGLIGTPALVIGQTVAMGAIESETIDRIVASEMERPGPSC